MLLAYGEVVCRLIRVSPVGPKCAAYHARDFLSEGQSYHRFPWFSIRPWRGVPQLWLGSRSLEISACEAERGHRDTQQRGYSVPQQQAEERDVFELLAIIESGLGFWRWLSASKYHAEGLCCLPGHFVIIGREVDVQFFVGLIPGLSEQRGQSLVQANWRELLQFKGGEDQIDWNPDKDCHHGGKEGVSQERAEEKPQRDLKRKN
jgi:hypothetical protein